MQKALSSPELPFSSYRRTVALRGRKDPLHKTEMAEAARTSRQKLRPPTSPVRFEVAFCSTPGIQFPLSGQARFSANRFLSKNSRHHLGLFRFDFSRGIGEGDLYPTQSKSTVCTPWYGPSHLAMLCYLVTSSTRMFWRPSSHSIKRATSNPRVSPELVFLSVPAVMQSAIASWIA